MEEYGYGHQFNWLFKEERLRRTPSIKIAISHAQELVFRQKQAMLMQAIGQKSGLTQLAINTSVIFMHRFYMYRTIKFFPRIHVAIGFVFAAGKVEESARKLEHLIRFTVDILRNNKNCEFLDKRDKLTYEMDCEWREKIETLCQNNCDISSVAYEEMRKTVLECETEIYAVIGFQLQITHPHKFVIRMSGQLGAENIKDISQYAYNLATVSSQLTMLNLKYKPETVATVCLNIASKAHSVKFMPMKDSTMNWYQVCDPNTDIKEIEAVSEEFLNLIKACQLLPSWMTNLARGPVRPNNRSQPGHPHRPAPTSSGSHHSSSQSRDPSRQPTQSSTSQANPTTESSSSSSGGHSHSQTALSISHSEGGSSTTATSSSSTSSSHPPVPSSSSHHSQHHRDNNRPQQLAPGAPANRSSSAVPGASNRHHPQHHPQQLHHQRSHPTSSSSRSSSGAPHKPQPPTSGSGNRQPPPSSTSSRLPPGSHPSQPNPSSALQYPPRPEHPRRSDTVPQDRRSQSQYTDPNHHHRSQQQQSASYPPPVIDNQNLSSSYLTEVPRSTPPLATQPQQMVASVPKPTTPPEPYPGSLSQQSLPNDTDFLASPSDSNSGSQPLHQQAAAMAATQGPKLSLSSYRERLGARVPRPTGQSNSSQNDSLNTDDSGIHTAASEENCSSLDVNTLSVDSPNNNSNVSTPDLASSFSIPQDSPTNSRLKVKVKRESSLAAGTSSTPGERSQLQQQHGHSVKYADSGLKIKIKPPKLDMMKGEESAGVSRSGTPVEDGEVFDSPGSTGSSDRRSDGSLKMRLTIPKRSGESDMNGSGDAVDQAASGGSGSHRSHHHSGHHHRKHHHHHKSKKHKQSSRHEGKSSKRSGGEHYDERPSKSSRMDHESQSSSSTLYRGSSTASITQNHQNSGFSINDAFSTAMPNNIFDDEDESTPPPITPTPDMLQPSSHHHHRLYRQSSSSSSRKAPSSSSSLPSMNSLLDDAVVPPHHQHFHQLMAQHRANEAKKPPLPHGQPPPPPPPPPSAS